MKYVAAVALAAVLGLMVLEASIAGHEQQPVGCMGTEHVFSDGRTLCVKQDGQ